MSRNTVSVEELMKIAARRQTNARKGLLPIAQRLSTTEMNARDTKIWARRTVAEKLSAKQNMMAMVLQHYFTRNFFGRVKHLLTGK